MMNVLDQGVPNAPEVQPQVEISNDEFMEVINMLSQVVENQDGQRENYKKGMILRGSMSS